MEGHDQGEIGSTCRRVDFRDVHVSCGEVIEESVGGTKWDRIAKRRKPQGPI